jgi:hypothetical protein
MKLNTILLSALLTILLMFVIPFMLSAEAQQLKPYPPDVDPYGVPYEEWGKIYWKNLVAIPGTETPMEDTSGDRCTDPRMTTENVWFATGAGGSAQNTTRNCVVPEGMSIFIMAESSGFAQSERPGLSNEGLLNLATKSVEDTREISLTIDGQLYNISYLKDNYRFISPAYPVFFGNPPVFGGKAGDQFLASDDIYVITEPITKGIHKIDIFAKGYKNGIYQTLRDVHYILHVN